MEKVQDRKQVEAELAKARAALDECREAMKRARDKVEYVQCRIEHGLYPSFQTESFVHDDRMEQKAWLRKLDELEVRETDLEREVLAWETTLDGL